MKNRVGLVAVLFFALVMPTIANGESSSASEDVKWLSSPSEYDEETVDMVGHGQKNREKAKKPLTNDSLGSVSGAAQKRRSLVGREGNEVGRSELVNGRDSVSDRVLAEKGDAISDEFVLTLSPRAEFERLRSQDSRRYDFYGIKVGKVLKWTMSESIQEGDKTIYVWHSNIIAKEANYFSLCFGATGINLKGELYVYRHMKGVKNPKLMDVRVPLHHNKKVCSYTVQGEKAIAEYRTPDHLDDPNASDSIKLLTLSYAPHDRRSSNRPGIDTDSAFLALDFDGVCERNVCDAPSELKKNSDAVARIFIKERGVDTGSLCTGSVLNNRKQDGTPYFLTDSHCLPPNPDLENAEFIWYKRDIAGGGGFPCTTEKTSRGAILIYDSADSELGGGNPNSARLDAALLKLRLPVPYSDESGIRYYLGYWAGGVPARTRDGTVDHSEQFAVDSDDGNPVIVQYIGHPGGRPQRFGYGKVYSYDETWLGPVEGSGNFITSEQESKKGVRSLLLTFLPHPR